VGALARLPRRWVGRFEARCRESAVRAARRSIDWILGELAGRAALYRIVDDIVAYLVRHPDVEELVRRQSATLVGEAVDELRTGSARADNAIDRTVLAIRRRLGRA
jgi:hypothetical protein